MSFTVFLSDDALEDFEEKADVGNSIKVLVGTKNDLIEQRLINY
jgi:hypothetical protein